jgi:hypothetical protein
MTQCYEQTRVLKNLSASLWLRTELRSCARASAVSVVLKDALHKSHRTTLHPPPLRSIESNDENIDDPVIKRWRFASSMMDSSLLRPFQDASFPGGLVDDVVHRDEFPTDSVLSNAWMHSPGKLNAAVLASSLQESLAVLAGGALLRCVRSLHAAPPPSLPHAHTYTSPAH